MYCGKVENKINVFYLREIFDFDVKYFWCVDVEVSLFEVYSGDVWFFIIIGDCDFYFLMGIVVWNF